MEIKCQCVQYNKGLAKGHMSGYKVGKVWFFFFACLVLFFCKNLPTLFDCHIDNTHKSFTSTVVCVVCAVSGQSFC